jgi:hypothetical protein
MNSLLADVIAAHGGWDRWSALRRVQATIITRGSLWKMKSISQDETPRVMTVELHNQRASLSPFGASGVRTAYTPDRIAIENVDGSTISERKNPRDSFRGQTIHSPWDVLQRAYFNGYALWNYLTMPFLLAMDGVEVNEMSALHVEGEVWRRLNVQFPGALATHCESQVFYIGDDLLVRRHDYKVDVAGGLPAAHYVSDYAEANGIRFPTKRRAFSRVDSVPTRNLLVGIDLTDVRFS